MRSFNPKKTTKQIVSFLRREFKKAGFKKGIIALSGGIDSATTAFLATKALGGNNVYFLMLPYKSWHNEAVVHANLVTKKLKIPKKSIFTVDIAPMVDGYWKSKVKSQKSKVDKIRLGNIMARVRMAVLYDHAKALSALVVGTENRSEYYLSYFTRFGDEASDIEAIRSLYKTQVFQLGKYLGVPQEILEKAPTAGLWKGQTDEGEFGFTYKDADEILYQLFDKKKKPAELTNFPKSLVKKVVNWVEKNDFKHHLPRVLE